MPAKPPGRPTPGRLLGLYALSVMDREGELYGYQLTARVAERTFGGWRPGPGAVYPALDSLRRRGWASVVRSGRRRVYRILPAGRAILRRLRSRSAWRSRHGPDLGLLWAEIAGVSDPGRFLASRWDALSERYLEYLRAPNVPVRTRREHLRDWDRRLSAVGTNVHALARALPGERRRTGRGRR